MLPCWHISSRSPASHALGFCVAELFCFNFNLSGTRSSSCHSSLDEKCLGSDPGGRSWALYCCRDIQQPPSSLQLFLCGDEFGQTCCLAKLTGEQGKVSRWMLEARSVTEEHMFKADITEQARGTKSGFPRWGGIIPRCMFGGGRLGR